MKILEEVWAVVWRARWKHFLPTAAAFIILGLHQTAVVAQGASPEFEVPVDLYRGAGIFGMTAVGLSFTVQFLRSFTDLVRAIKVNGKANGQGDQSNKPHMLHRRDDVLIQELRDDLQELTKETRALHDVLRERLMEIRHELRSTGDTIKRIEQQGK